MYLNNRNIVTLSLAVLLVLLVHGYTLARYNRMMFPKGVDISLVADKVSPIAITFPEINFTDPVEIYTHSQYSYTIINRFIDLLKAVPSGDTVYMSMYLFSHRDAIEAIKEADERGVVVNLLVDSSRNESIKSNKIAYEAFSGLKHGHYATVANDIAYGNDNSKGIDHNKFAIFSTIVTTVGAVHDVVFQTSNNFTNTQCSYFQDNVILVNAGLFESYKAVWIDIYNHAKSNMNGVDFREYDDAAVGLHAYFFPKIRNGKYFGTDPVDDILDQVTNPEKDTIRLLMATWTPSRSNILEKLASLLNKGAHVEIITSADGAKGMVPALLNLMQKGAYVRLFEVPTNTKLKKNVHSKYLLINGYINHTKGSILATGSENYTSPALKANNETLLVFKDCSFFDAYVANFNTIKNL